MSRVLVIEDDAKIADSLVRGLGEEGYLVTLCPDGDSGRKAMSEEHWDLIILDWSLPGLDGLTLLRRYRKQGGLTPILFLTAQDSISDRVRALDGGADDYLCKPFDFEELLARVRARIRRGSQSTGGIVAYRNLKLDVMGGRVERGGAPLDLTPKETSLLSFFMQHPNEVLTRSRIYEQVWDEAYDGLSNTLEFHVVELRRKLEAHGPRLIHTVRRRGYLFGDAPAGSS